MLSVVLPGAVGARGRSGHTRLVPSDAGVRGVRLTVYTALDGEGAAALKVLIPLTPVALHGFLVIGRQGIPFPRAHVHPIQHGAHLHVPPAPGG